MRDSAPAAQGEPPQRASQGGSRAPSATGVSESNQSASLPSSTPGRGALNSLVQESLAALSKEAKSIVELPSFCRLKEVLNSTIGNTKPFAHVDVSRWEHSVHAAAESRRLPNAVRDHLTSYEQQVLELATLLHDYGHVFGSHAMDRVFHSLTDSPKIGEYGYTEEEYHEYHGALLLGTGEDAGQISALLGNSLLRDVMAVLTFDDKRAPEVKFEDYGVLGPTLQSDRIRLLYTLKDKLDRVSYLKTDYLSGGYREDIVQNAINTVDEYRDRLAICESQGGAEVASIGDEQLPAAFYKLREFQFKNISPGHPLSGIQTAFLQQSVSNVRLRSALCYKDMREALLRNKCAPVMGEMPAKMFLSGDQCVSDVIAPLVTLLRSDFDKGSKALAKFEKGEIPEGLGEQVRITSVQQISLLELLLRHKFQDRGVELYCVLSPLNSEKDIPYKVVNYDDEVARASFRSRVVTGSAAYVIIAASAVNADGEQIELGPLQRDVANWLSTTGFLKSTVDIQGSYNPRIFVDLATPEVFEPSIARTVSNHRPAWIKKGGCGLLDKPLSSTHLYNPA